MRLHGLEARIFPSMGKSFVEFEYIHIYIYMVAPPQGPPEREGMYQLPSVVLNAFKDMLRKHCKFQCFMHILLVVL